jgi:hypothetical protein
LIKEHETFNELNKNYNWDETNYTEVTDFINDTIELIFDGKFVKAQKKLKEFNNQQAFTN